MPDKPFYPERALERHGVPPDAFDSAGCYALALRRPTSVTSLRTRWRDTYDVAVPKPLSEAVRAEHAICYIGATNDLLSRLHDHVAADVRRVGLLAVCPPTDLAAVWLDDEPGVSETQYAYAYSREHPETVVAANGDWF